MARPLAQSRAPRAGFLEEGRCDILEVTGKRPAVYGFDIGHLGKGWVPANGYMVSKIREAYESGGVITVVWHSENPVTGSGCYAGSPVESLLPGAAGNRSLIAHLDLIADNLGNLKTSTGASIPIIFRCWHEANGEHFWWGRSRCTPDEYVRLFRFTVNYLRDVRRVHNFLYVYSPGDNADDGVRYLDRYPGDEFVDVLGLDSYGDGGEEHRSRLLGGLRDLVRFAESRGKVPALTEVGFKQDESNCGLGHCTDAEWLSARLIEPIKRDPVASRLAYIAFWRNEAYRPTDFYLPYRGNLHAECLARLADDPFLVFSERLNGIYRRSPSHELTVST